MLSLPMPSSNDIEEVVLGTLLINKQAIFQVIQILNNDCFYFENNLTVFKAIMRLHNTSQPIDLLTVIEELKKMKMLDEIGGPHHLVELTNRVASMAHIEKHSQMLCEYSLRRKLIEEAETIQRMSFDLGSDIFSVLGTAKKRLFTHSAPTVSRIANLGHHVNAIIEKSKSMENKFRDVHGLPTGFEELDLFSTGFQPGRFYVIGGRPSMGKTTFVINALSNCVKMFGHDGLFFSGEMSAEEITTIILAKESGIPMEEISKNAVTEKNWREILNKMGDGLLKGFHIDDTANPSIMHVQAESHKMKEKHKIKWIAVDYLQLMRGSQRGMQRKEEVSEISRELKGLARNLGVPVIALAQLSRQCENRPDKRPVMSDLKETGDIEQDADFIAFLYRPEYYGTFQDGKGHSLRGIVEFIVRKNKFGRTDKIFLFLEKEIGRFYGFDTDTKDKIAIEDYDMSLIELKSMINKNELPKGITKDDVPF